MKKTTIDATDIHYKILNERIRELAELGYDQINVKGVCGHKFLAAGLSHKITIEVEGVPGNDLGVFMNGLEILVHDDVQDGSGNTMNSGRIVIYGNAGDITGHSMRDGEIFVKGDTGYRAGIHMKEYKDMYPVVVVGGRAGSFLGEYMAGGLIIVLGLDKDSSISDYTGTGMHGGRIYVRGKIEDVILGKEVKMFEIEDNDLYQIMPYLESFSRYFGVEPEKICEPGFKKIVPVTHRPYGKIYSY